MATSGSTDFSLNRNQIIKRSLQLLGIVGAAENVSNEDNDLAADFLNMMIKEWSIMGLNTWTSTEATLYLRDGVEKYTLNSAAGDAEWSKTTVETTLSADEALGQTVLSVTSSTGMTAGDVCLVVLDDKTYEDTTIVSVDSGAQITVTDALTSAATSGNYVYTFTTRATQPLEVQQIRRRDRSDNDMLMREMSRSEYFALATKDTNGSPNSWYLDRQRDDAFLYVWPTPDFLTERLKITYTRKLEDLDSGTDDIDFPPEWTMGMVYNLAAMLAPIFGRDAKLQSLGPLANRSLSTLLSHSNENQTINMIADSEHAEY